MKFACNSRVFSCTNLSWSSGQGHMKSIWNLYEIQIKCHTKYTWNSYEHIANIISCALQSKWASRSIVHLDTAWWRHQMETFSALLAICAGNSPVSGEFPAQRPVTQSFDVFFDVRLIKRLSKHSRGWWFETLSHPLWRHRNGIFVIDEYMVLMPPINWGIGKYI